MTGKKKTEVRINICDACREISSIRQRYTTSRCTDCKHYGNLFEQWLVAYLLREVTDHHKTITQLKTQHNRIIRYFHNTLIPEVEASTGKKLSDSALFLIKLGEG